MKLKLEVEDKYMPKGYCPITYYQCTSRDIPCTYLYCAINGNQCDGDLKVRPDDCPIIEVEE